MSDNPEVFIDPKMSAAAEEIKSEVISPGSDPKWLQVWFMNPMRIAWDWNDLFEDATTAGENLNLTIAGLVLSNNVEFAAREGEAVLRQLGFDGIRSEHYLLSTETKNKISKPARTFGHKKIERQGKEYHVFCAVFKGTTTLPDTITDIKSILDGFYMGGLSCAESLKEYMDSFEGAEKDNSILFITGHSLGASTANVVGRISRGFVNDNALFVYSFASPNYETEGEWNNGKSYPNFHYFTNADDVVPRVPHRLSPHYFSKIGVEHRFLYGAMEKEQREKFNRAYRHFRHMTFEEDKDLLGLGLKETESLEYMALKNHMCHTYMSFVLSELSNEKIDQYLAE